MKTDDASPVLPNDIDAVRRAARDCTACHLYENATQTVFGEGPRDAAIMLVGEQPGDQEDLQGRPFVGPAGRILDQALEEAGLDRQAVYITNAVKHFKFEPRGKRRLHKKPVAAEIAACSHWLQSELTLIGPRVVVLMGATAVRAVLSKGLTISANRGKPLPLLPDRQALVTVHPSYLLRIRDAQDKARTYSEFVADLKLSCKIAA